jgi:hypothetical protein
MKEAKQAVTPILRQNMENWNRQCLGGKKATNTYVGAV